MSDTPKHTPGPWVIQPMDEARWIDIEKLGGSVPFVSCMHMDQKPNAHLIAAAPEMLETLKECRLFIGRMPHPDFANGGTVDLIYKNILHVIAKAEGRQQ
jgi:hypothetical protein